ncbi:Proteasome subunit beta type-4 [Blastocladiella emersonii ATCC 22665]|nr:Proteasome subunit beta type-4 [Blastocladiella emersonii ATCC 22665]
MESLFGVVGKDFVVVASDMSSIRSIVVLKSHEDRTRDLNSHNVLLYTGEPGDCVQFSEYIQRNVQLYSIKNDVPLNTAGCASFTRRALADSLRSRGAYQTNLLIAGWDPKDGPRLYWIDYLSSGLSVPFACQGYGGYFCYSTMDRYYHSDMTKDEAVALIKKCIAELKTRFVANLPNWQIKIIDKDGITVNVVEGSAV